MRSFIVFGEHETEVAREMVVSAEMFRKKASIKKLLLKDYDEYHEAMFPAFDGEPEVKFLTSDYMAPARKDGAEFTPADIEAVTEYYRSLADDRDYELPDHMDMKWRKTYRAQWSVIVPNEFLDKKD